MRHYLLWASLAGFVCLSGIGCCCLRQCGSRVGGMGCVGEPCCGSCGEVGDCGCGEVAGDCGCGMAPTDCGCGIAAPSCGTACGGCDDCASTCGVRCRRGWPLLRAIFGCAGCSGNWYWSEWYSDPPDCCDPCDGCGNWNGPVDSCASCGGGAGCATCGTGAGCSTCDTGAGCSTCGKDPSPVLAGPELAPTPVALEGNDAAWR